MMRWILPAALRCIFRGHRRGGGLYVYELVTGRRQFPVGRSFRMKLVGYECDRCGARLEA